MKYSEALEIIHELAVSNQIDANDIAFGDSGLTEQRAWQQEALNTLEDLVTNHGESIDDRFPSAPVSEITFDDVAADRSADPSNTQSAIRISLDMARGAVLTDAGSEELQEEQDRQNLAVSTVENFIVNHGPTLDASMTSIRM